MREERGRGRGRGDICVIGFRGVDAPESVIVGCIYI